MQEDREQRKKMDTIKKIKTIKTIVAISGGSFPVVLVLMLVFASAVAALLPIFIVTTMVGGETVYGSDKSDLPNDLTIEGIDTWSDDEKKMFNDMTKEKEYFDNDFSNYNATEIMANKNEILDVSTPISTIHYQGVVNLTTFDDEYMKEIFNDGTFSTDYNAEKNVQNNHTRDFYKQAGEKVGNTFMIYPGMRMLLGNMVKNIVFFDTVDCGIRECPAGSFSSWRLLGKIASSNESDASSSYGVGAAIDKLVTAIQDGEKGCSSESDEWKKQNMCYDTDLLFNEIFGERFSVNGRKSIIDYLEDRYSGSDSKAHVPLSSYISDGYYSPGTYISVTVQKKIDYNLYEKYLKEIYIPYIYINCDSCGFQNASDDMKKDHIDTIYKEIMQLTSAFKHYNNEDYIDGAGGTSGIGGTGTIKGVTYECGTNYVSVSTDYCSTPGCRAHNANDISVASSLTSPNIYPIMEGEVVVVNNSCYNICPSSDASRYIAGASLSSLSSACSCGGGFGNYIRIKSTYNGKTVYATYAHLSSVNVSVGETVTYNTILGVMGTTGVSTGRHLHLELSYNSDYSNKFPATVLFTTDTVRGTTCSRNISSEEQV